MSPHVFTFLRTVLAALVTAIAAAIINIFDKFGSYDSSQYDYE